MEHRKPHEIANRLLEARMALRTHLAIETVLIERIDELPYDDFRHFARECFQMGAGYAYQQVQASEYSVENYPPDIFDLTHEEMEDAFATFFATQPRNRYLDEEAIHLEQKTISLAAMTLVETGEMPELESRVDKYQVEAAAGFVEGYLIVTSMVRPIATETEIAG